MSALAFSRTTALLVGAAAFASTVLFAAGSLAVWTAYGLAAYGVFRLVAASPGSVPGLTEPGGSPSMEMAS